MARVKISEYRAKKLILGNAYRGLELQGGVKLPGRLTGQWVAKVDQGVKKRFKQGLVAIGSRSKLVAALNSWKKKGFSRFIVEPFVPHKENEEQYLSLEGVREGIRVLHATKIPESFLSHLLETFNANFFAFLELNPLVVRKNEAYLLDAAALVDSAGAFFTRVWSESDIVETKSRHPAEERVKALDATTPASLKLSVLNKNGGIFFLLSAGGGSIVIADQAELAGAGKLIGNYGEYSGGPTRP